jgi:RNA polymerase sigma factor (sigma-70 family)
MLDTTLSFVCHPDEIGPGSGQHRESDAGHCVGESCDSRSRIDEWTQFVAGLRSGEQGAAREFCDRFGPALHRMAESHLPGGLRRRLGAEDVVQSACRTFLRRVRDQQFQLADSRGLWRLMCAITLTKVREQTRFHRRKRRGFHLEAADVPNDSAAGPQLARHVPAPDEAAMFADEFRRLLESLDAQERQVVELKLEDRTNVQVAEAMGLSERTVRRILSRLKDRVERAFAAS